MVKQVVCATQNDLCRYQVLTAVWLRTKVFWNVSDYVTFPDILKDHCAYILRGKQSKNKSSPLVD